MTRKIKIDIVSDIVCPWCIIGYKRLQQAITDLNLHEKITLEWHPYELNSHMGSEGEDVYQHVAEKYGMSAEESIQSFANMSRLGNEVGFELDFFDDMKIVNTFDAHLLLDYANEFDKQTELKIAFFKAFFSDRKDVSDRSVLLLVIKDVGLDPDEATRRLDDDVIQKRVISEQAYWRNQGVSAVPTMIFDGDRKFTGAQSISEYKRILTETIEG